MLGVCMGGNGRGEGEERSTGPGCSKMLKIIKIVNKKFKVLYSLLSLACFEYMFVN